MLEEGVLEEGVSWIPNWFIPDFKNNLLNLMEMVRVGIEQTQDRTAIEIFVLEKRLEYQPPEPPI